MENIPATRLDDGSDSWDRLEVGWTRKTRLRRSDAPEDTLMSGWKRDAGEQLSFFSPKVGSLDRQVRIMNMSPQVGLALLAWLKENEEKLRSMLE